MENIRKTPDCPRVEALRIMYESLPLEDKKRNTQFVESLKTSISLHSLNQHEAIAILNSGKLSLSDLQEIHLEYREAIVQIFTDALSAAIFNARQLEPRLNPGSKMAARSLLTLNCLDEFGFKPGINSNNYYIGTPEDAHYPLFEKVLSQLGINQKQINEFKPSKDSVELKSFLESSYNSYSIILALLAVAEIQVIKFSPALRKATNSFEIDVSSGYYHVHGISSDELCEAADDDHEDDLWHALIQSLTEDMYSAVESQVGSYLNLWSAFWDNRVNSIKGGQGKAA